MHVSSTWTKISNCELYDILKEEAGFRLHMIFCIGRLHPLMQYARTEFFHGTFYVLRGKELHQTQNTVKSSSFGRVFVALQVAQEMILALRCKLRMSFR